MAGTPSASRLGVGSRQRPDAAPFELVDDDPDAAPTTTTSWFSFVSRLVERSLLLLHQAIHTRGGVQREGIRSATVLKRLLVHPRADEQRRSMRSASSLVSRLEFAGRNRCMLGFPTGDFTFTLDY